MSQKIVLDRAVTKEECPWLSEDLPEGGVYYLSSRFDYGVCSPSGIMVGKDPGGDYPHFEVPLSAVKYLGD